MLIGRLLCIWRNCCSLQRRGQRLLRLGYSGGWILDVRNRLRISLDRREGPHLLVKGLLGLLALFGQQAALNSWLGLLERRHRGRASIQLGNDEKSFSSLNNLTDLALVRKRNASGNHFSRPPIVGQSLIEPAHISAFIAASL